MPSDAELIDAVRGGTIEAYGKLYERHARAALNLALQLTGSTTDADDLVSDAFAKVLAALRAGGGPDAAFRPYLLTAVRHTAYDKTRKDRRVELAGDIEDVPGATRVTSVPFRDTAVAELDQMLAASAFASLPERWQTVLWHTAIEGQSPGEIAPLLGLTANGVSAMAHRAREGLRRAYLQAHVATDPSDRCRATVAKLGAWTRSGLSGRESIQLNAHLDRCAECRHIASELADVNGALRAVVAPLVLGTAAAGYLGLSKASAVVSAGTTSWLGVAAASTAVVIVVSAGIGTPAGPTDPSVAAVPTTTTTTAATATTGTAVSGTSNSTAPAGTPNAPGTSSESGVSSGVVAPPQETPGGGGEPALVATAPGNFTTSTGGPPSELSISLANIGSGPASAPTLTLTLPDDIKTVGPGNTEPGTVGCPAGKGTVTCTGQTLAANESMRFVFRLLAGPKATSGTITGITDTGVRVQIPITITPKK